tara:strand:- start:2846 stop:4063 length:1218 start_codon:yes stop_codon:yes gene_type:complete
MQINTHQNIISNSPKNGITFLIPALNEEESIEFTIDLCIKFSKKNPEIPCEILVCDNDSEDSTVRIAKKMGCTVIIEKNKGYGSNIINGIKNSKYDYIIFGDADGSYDFSDSRKFYDLLEKDFDLIMGNRFSKNKEYQMEKKSMRFLHKYLGNPVLSFIARFMFQINIADFHCGLRALRKKSFNDGNIFLCKGMEFATEVVAVASKLGLKVTEVPVKLYADKRKKASPHLNTWKDGWRHLKFILAMSHSKIFINFAIFFLTINWTFHLFYFFREFFQIDLLTNLSLVTSLFLNAFSYVGLNLIILSIFLSRTIKINYNVTFVENEKIQNMLTKINSDTFFKVSGIILLILFYTTYFIFSTWKESGFNFLDLNSPKIIYHILIFSQSIPILLFLIKMGFINYIIKK